MSPATALATPKRDSANSTGTRSVGWTLRGPWSVRSNYGVLTGWLEQSNDESVANNYGNKAKKIGQQVPEIWKVWAIDVPSL
ncbi:hypothetical protein Tco_0841370 [Tanacetum coccineum]|uniref:Uncharacterized protein n=1 Tax=Tanacetum coccineum TaxID=301880 RepID=A0ABQ5AXI1_9ASTR